ncbi:heat-inducible transcriptional repressor HrcA [Chloroflexota bacterium]
MLLPRTEAILRAIVGEYIIRATPVPSQSLVDDYRLGVSPATVRNEMAHLEHEGYIARPHTSAGSVPTDKGYRYYVDSLTDLELPLTEQRLISHLFHQVERKLEEWLVLAATLLAQLTQNVAIVAAPKSTDCRFKHMELIALQDSLTLAILVLQGARVKQHLINFDQDISQPRLTAITNKLNSAYSGLTNSQILSKKVELSPIEKQLTDWISETMQVEDKQEIEEPYFNGLHFMLSQPEFTRSQRALALMELVEQRNLLRTIIPREMAGRGILVIIGGENKAEIIQDYSVVIGRYGLPDEAVGTVGVVGPTRMPYARTISTVGYLSSVLSGLLAELYGKETGLTRHDTN